MSTLTPNMEAISVPGSISGSAIIDSICNRIGDKLSRDCSLRSIDVYSGYSYKVVVEIQLHDVYEVEIAATVAEGKIDPHQPSQFLELGSDVIAAAPEAANLEKPIDATGFIEAPAAEAPKSKRYYSPPVERK